MAQAVNDPAAARGRHRTNGPAPTSAESGGDARDVAVATASPSDGLVATRRGLLSGAGIAVIVGTADAGDVPIGVHRDAELLHLLARFDALERSIWPAAVDGPRTMAEEDAREALMAPLRAEQHAMLDRICGLRASTVAGWRARARSLLLWDGEMRRSIESDDDPDGYMNERLLEALVRDVAAAGPSQARPSRAAAG